ncbi:hypothetical protein VP1G_10870 [Cytospora mali]|uniref:Uncharacterized protein n=1 Tax=Cytospora mali TaxID=578113 RepID=A0A194UY20_CYTMA|nr:hypothetical protein VP1G_10870 [Valsa mali var. pyri (nom. inval.)]
MRRHSHISLLTNRIRRLPERRDGLELRVEVDTRLPVEGARAAPGDRPFVPREAEHGQRHGNGHVDADLAGLDVAPEGLGRAAGAREDGDAVAVLVGVDQLDGVVQRLHVEAHQRRPEDLLLVALHPRRDVRDDRRAHPVPVRVLGRLVAPPVQQYRRALLLRAGDEPLDALLALGRDHGAQVRALLEPAVDVQRLGALGQLGQPLLRLADHNQRAQGHAPLSGRAKGGADDGVEELVLVAVRQHGGVVLGAQVGLHTLPVGRAPREDVLAGLVAADEADGLDGRVVQDEVDGAVRAVDDVDDARREARLLGQFGEDHGRARVALRGLEHERVAGHGGDGDAPEGYHGWEHLRHTTRRLGDLQAPQDITPGIRKRLALLERDARGQAVPILPDQADELEHDLLPRHDAGVPPRGEGLLGGGDGGLELGVRHLRDAGDEVVRRRVVELDQLLAGRGPELVV